MSLADNDLQNFLKQQTERRTEREKIVTARLALLEKLGITEEEARLLLS